MDNRNPVSVQVNYPLSLFYQGLLPERVIGRETIYDSIPLLDCFFPVVSHRASAPGCQSFYLLRPLVKDATEVDADYIL